MDVPQASPKRRPEYRKTRLGRARFFLRRRPALIDCAGQRSPVNRRARLPASGRRGENWGRGNDQSIYVHCGLAFGALATRVARSMLGTNMVIVRGKKDTRMISVPPK